MDLSQFPTCAVSKVLSKEDEYLLSCIEASSMLLSKVPEHQHFNSLLFMLDILRDGFKQNFFFF